MRTPRLLIALALCSVVQAQRTTWIVDPAGAGQFTNLQAAADAAAPGDVLRLRSGNAGSLVTSKPLVILGETNFTSEVGSITVQDLPSGSETILDHLVVDYSSTSRMVLLRRCAGRVVLDGVRQRAWSSYLNAFVYFMEVTDCRDVSMVRCNSLGNPGAIVTDSDLTLDRCQFQTAFAHITPSHGRSALDVVRSRVWIQSSSCIGNSGQVANGYGIRALDSELRIGSGTTLHSAFGPSRSIELNWSSASTDPGVPLSFVSLQTSSLVAIALPTVQVAGALGGTMTASMQSDLGGVTLLALGESRTPLPIGRAGSIGLDLSHLTTVFGVGGTPLTLTLPIPNDPRLFGASFGAQGCHLDANGDLWLSNRAPLVLL